MAVIESVTKLVATGFRYEDAYLSFQEYFERLGNKPERWGKPLAALLGALDAQIGLGIASIGGKDSMSGSFEQLDVPPHAGVLCHCHWQGKPRSLHRVQEAGEHRGARSSHHRPGDRLPQLLLPEGQLQDRGEHDRRRHGRFCLLRGLRRHCRGTCSRWVWATASASRCVRT